jgi:hypothetical protein
MSLNEIEPQAGDRPGDPAATAAQPAGSAPTPRRPPQREPLYFVVILLLIADIVFGLGLAVFAEKVIAFRPMAVVGLGLAGLGLGILAYFVLFGSGRPRQ